MTQTLPLGTQTLPLPVHPVALAIQCRDEWFGLPISHVYTVFHIETVTPVPLAPPEILGLVNLRGQIVTVVSLRARLGMPAAPKQDDLLAVAVHHAGENYALLIDAVADVVDLESWRPIQSQPHVDPSRSALTREVYRMAGRTIPVLDVAALLTFSSDDSRRPASHAEHANRRQS
ncbi:MAG: chemotaxis protein CheW [Hyphomicrobiales bacterium]|nr:chemotaxis protein CheW [Hyphomicrobiales bacterium]